MEEHSYLPPHFSPSENKRFSILVVAVVLVIVGTMAPLSAYLYRLDIPYTDNDIIRQYHFARLNGTKDIETLIVGDSSAGNAIDAGGMSQILNSTTYNAALTGSFGLEGSYNIIRQALSKGQPLKTVIIIQTLDIWHRPFAEQGLVETASGLSLLEANEQFPGGVSEMKYLINPKEVWWFAKYRFHPTLMSTIENGYLAQHTDTYANGARVIRPTDRLSSTIDASKVTALKLITEECWRHNLHCYYFHGPLHRAVGEASRAEIARINAVIAPYGSFMTVVSEPLLLLNEEVGDSIDHVLPAAKAASTAWYAGHIIKGR